MARCSFGYKAGGCLAGRVPLIAAVILVVLALGGPVSAAEKQMGSFLSEQNAKGLVSKLKSEGKDAYVIQKNIKGKLFYIVSVREGVPTPKTKPVPKPEPAASPTQPAAVAPTITPVAPLTVIPLPKSDKKPEPAPAPTAPAPTAPVSRPALQEGIEPIEGMGKDFSLYYPNSAKFYKQPSKDAPVIMSREKAGPITTLGASGQDWYAVKLYSTNEVLYVYRDDVIRYSLKQEAPAIANAPASEAPPKQVEPKKNEKTAPSPAAPAMREVFALGGFLNPTNLSAGPKLVYKPLQNLGFEAMVGVGPFITAEARIVLKGQSRPRYNPYIGAGFMYTQAKAEVRGKQQKFSDTGYNLSLGLDANYGHGWHGFIELGYNNIELKGKVTSGTETVNAEVDYSTITGIFGMFKYF